MYQKHLKNKTFYRLRNIFNCVLPQWRHLTAGLLYNDFGCYKYHAVRISNANVYERCMNKQDMLEMRHASTPDMTHRIFLFFLKTEATC